jgi:hypothetical protein
VAHPPAAEKPAEKPAEPPPRASPAARIGAAPVSDAATGLQRLTALYDSLEYDQVTTLAEQLLAREDLTLDQRLEAYRLLGSAKAIVEDPIDAEQPFRLLLRARADYELPATTPPKILGVFRKVQSEERALASQLHEVERARVIANLKLLGEPPQRVKGGLPLKFSFRLRDPTSAVEAVRVPYRRAGQKVFSALALDRSDEGDWRGAIPGDVLADEKGFVLEYFIETTDAHGPLLSLGTEARPRNLQVEAGLVPTARFKPVHRGVFWTSTGLTIALGLASGALGVSLVDTQAAYQRFVARAPTVVGSSRNDLVAKGNLLADFTNAAWISAASMAVVTLLLLPFTDFAP